MIVLDANLLLYAYTARSSFHQPARSYLDHIFSDTSESIGIPIQCATAFLRLITNPAVTGARIAMDDAIARVEEWQALPHVRILYPGEEHWQFLKTVTRNGHATGDLIADAAIAAFALEYGAVVHSNDRDFARFSSIRWHNPLA
ncbi:TA system VapC family ribonuclease toxin [Granulicella tundricola]|uniref:Ribonuclease VapC n=1 Tax=Granulicella tundricola (strain ATCC BAA-1859 / DSM 23138 / MP5ACTX9) TaxID=1198114 RepID=E8X1V8_GRATM|nr:TA system VapC family ribonuclease toxin [Granulicella tundricola]ADW69119.1 PIN domain protein family protein [Granulicella tundricola MP5ACTX9]